MQYLKQWIDVIFNSYVDKPHHHILAVAVPGPSSEFVGIKSQYVKRYKRRWEESKLKPAKLYGKCIQTVSISQRNTGGTCSRISADDFSPKIVLTRQTGDLPRLSMAKINNILNQQQIQPQRTIIRSGTDELLGEDVCARRLALEHEVDVVLSDRVCETLLKSQEWILPISYQRLGRERDVVFIDDPLPSSSLPRDCLSIGMTESLYGQVLRSDSLNSVSSKQYVYTVLNVMRQGCNVNMLVRSENYLLDERGSALSIETSMEYFHDRGMEVIPIGYQAHWFMQKILQPEVRPLLCRIDPCSATVLRVEEKTVADAITVGNDADNEKGVGSLYSFERIEETTLDSLIQSMMDTLFATTKFERDFKRRSVMCHPGRHESVSCGTAVSIHKEINNVASEKALVDVEKELEDANQVFLSTPDYRLWSWDDDRIAYTFPVEGA